MDGGCVDLANVNLLHPSFTRICKYKGCACYTQYKTNLSECPNSTSRQEAESQTAISRCTEEKETATVDTCFQVTDAVNMRLEAQ